MKELFGIPVYESEAAGDNIYLIPNVDVKVYEPPQGFGSLPERLTAERNARIEAYREAVKQGRVVVVTNVDFSKVL